MPYSVRVNELTNTITLLCWGDITVHDLMEYERRMWGGPEHVGFHHIVDMQVADLKLDLNEGLMLVTHATPADPNAYSGARTALVVGNAEQRRLCEMYRDARHSVCSPEIREVGVFDDMEKARAWVQESQVTRVNPG